MDYQLNDKGFAGWIRENLPEALFAECYKVYQNEIKSALIARKNIWYGDGIEEITPAMLKNLKAELSAEPSLQNVWTIAVLSYMELFLNQGAAFTETPAKPALDRQNPIQNIGQNQPQTQPISEAPVKPAPCQRAAIPDVKKNAVRGQSGTVNIEQWEKSWRELLSDRKSTVENRRDSVAASSAAHKAAIPTVEKPAVSLKLSECTPAKPLNRGMESAAADENVDGAQLHKDLSFTDYKWTQPDSFTYKGRTYSTKEFSDLYIRVLELLIRDYPEQMADLPKKYSWFKDASFNGTVSAKRLSNGIYACTNYHRYDLAKYLQKIFKNLGLPLDTLYIDSHRDYSGHALSQKRVNRFLKSEEVVLYLNDDWKFKAPVSYTLLGKQTKIETKTWVDFYVAILEELIRIDPTRMDRLPSINYKNFSYTDFPSSYHSRVLSNGIRVSGFKADTIEEMLTKILAYLNISSTDFEIQAIQVAK